MEKRTNLLIYPFAIMVMFLMLTNSCKKDDNNNLPANAVKDIDGNVYNTVTIGTQVWMVENLKVTHYRDGTPIPNVTDNTAWGNLTTYAYCDYDNTSNNSTIYGKLYNWYAVNDSHKIAPAGWHVPTDDDWTIMENYLITNGYNYDGTTTGNKYAKALASATGWTSSVVIGTVGSIDYPLKRNASGFTALPGGNRDVDGTFSNIGYDGDWWSSTEYTTGTAWYRSMSYDLSDVAIGYCNHEVSGFSVRCLRD